MHHDVRPVLDRPAQVRRRKRVVDDERNAGVVRDGRQRIQIGDVELRIADRLRVERLGVAFARAAEIFRIVGIDERHVDAELRERDRKLRIGAAIQRSRRDEMIAGAAQREERSHLRGHSRGCGKPGSATLKRSDAFLERCDRRI